MYTTSQPSVCFPLQGVSVSVSVLTLTAISVERWYAICHPLSFKITAKRVRLTIIAIWLIAVTIMIPEVIVLDIERIVPAEVSDLLMACRPMWSPKPAGHLPDVPYCRALYSTLLPDGDVLHGHRHLSLDECRAHC